MAGQACGRTSGVGSLPARWGPIRQEQRKPREPVRPKDVRAALEIFGLTIHRVPGWAREDQAALGTGCVVRTGQPTGV